MGYDTRMWKTYLRDTERAELAAAQAKRDAARDEYNDIAERLKNRAKQRMRTARKREELAHEYGVDQKELRRPG